MDVELEKKKKKRLLYAGIFGFTGLVCVAAPTAAITYYGTPKINETLKLIKIPPKIEPLIPPMLTTLPCFLYMSFSATGESLLGNILTSLTYCSYYSILLYPIYKFINNLSKIKYIKENNININIKYRYLLLWLYTPILFKSLYSSKHIIFRLWCNIWWNIPLHIGNKLTNIIFKTNYYGTLISIIDNNIAIGTLPQSRYDVELIYKQPYNIRCIITMSNESNGPIHEYDKVS